MEKQLLRGRGVSRMGTGRKGSSQQETPHTKTLTANNCTRYCEFPFPLSPASPSLSPDSAMQSSAFNYSSSPINNTGITLIRH